MYAHIIASTPGLHSVVSTAGDAVHSRTGMQTSDDTQEIRGKKDWKEVLLGGKLYRKAHTMGWFRRTADRSAMCFDDGPHNRKAKAELCPGVMCMGNPLERFENQMALIRSEDRASVHESNGNGLCVMIDAQAHFTAELGYMEAIQNKLLKGVFQTIVIS